MHPQAENHLITAERHYQVAVFLRSSSPPSMNPGPDEWIIACLFCSAVHYVQAYFIETIGRGHESHVDRNNAIPRVRDLASIRLAYFQLFSWSQTARYDPLPTLDHRVQPAFDNLEDIAIEMKRLLKIR